MKGKGLRKRYAEWIQALSALLLIAIAGLTLHDMQTAEGAGLYLAIKAGAEDRRMYDFAVDAAGMLCLLVLLLLPCFLPSFPNFFHDRFKSGCARPRSCALPPPAWPSCLS